MPRFAARLAVATVLVSAVALPASAEPMPAGTIGPMFGVLSGTGADAKRLGFGMYQFGLQASWSPMATERRLGWSIRWATMFGTLYNGTAAQIDTELHTVQMDLLVGVRYRPWTTPSRYLTLRVGGELLRANEPIPTSSDPMAPRHRAFGGGVFSVGLDQYFSSFMFNVDVRYGLIGNGPRSLALLVGVGFTGP